YRYLVMNVYPPQKKLCLLSISAINFKQNKRMKSHFASSPSNNNMGCFSPMAIAGFEDSPFSRQTWPKLTTAAQPTNIIARKAAACLIQYLASLRNHKMGSVPIPRLFYRPQLVTRESTSSKVKN
ncbi:MAG: hypothetical protein ACI8VI_000362, partial [Granulosicoccus sp.]